MTKTNLELLREELDAKFSALSATTGFGGETQATWDSVLRNFVKVQSQWEGMTNFMYADQLGFVTTGMGDLIDSDGRGADKMHAAGNMNAYGPALLLPWKLPDGSRATEAQIISEWQLVKSKYPGIQSAADKNITQLRLDDSDRDALIIKRMNDNEKILLQSFAGFGTFPADAQMAIHGMGWAMGAAFVPAYHFTGFQNAANTGDWVTAKAQSHFKGEAPQRGVGQDLMFDNAVAVHSRGLDPSNFYYPGTPSTVPAPSGLSGRTVATVAIVIGLGATGYVYRDEVTTFAKESYVHGKDLIAKAGAHLPKFQLPKKGLFT